LFLNIIAYYNTTQDFEKAIAVNLTTVKELSLGQRSKSNGKNKFDFNLVGY
jgi:hypothetical protein